MTKLFKNLTLREKWVMFFNEIGAIEIATRTSKYLCFKTADQKGDIYLFIGKNGALRFNRKSTATDSISLTNTNNIYGIGFKKFCEAKENK